MAHTALLLSLLDELGGYTTVMPDSGRAMHVMLSSAAARGEQFAEPCLALLEYAMAPFADGSLFTALVLRIGVTARLARSEVLVESKALAEAREARGEEYKEAAAKQTKELRRRVGDLEQKVAAAKRAQEHAERERDVHNARYGRLLEESRGLTRAALGAESLRAELHVARAALDGARAREGHAAAKEAALQRKAREAAEIEAHADVMLAEQTRLRASLDAEVARADALRAELEAAGRFVAITERLARLVCAETVARAGGGSVDLTEDSTSALRTAIDLHHHATVFEPDGFLNSLLRATCPIRTMRAWVGASERDGEKRRAVARDAVASIREDCTSHKARQAMVRAMWEWADHAEVADVEGLRVRDRYRSGRAQADTVVASQDSVRCPLSASTGEMLAALVAARLRSFDRWRRGG